MMEIEQHGDIGLRGEYNMVADAKPGSTRSHFGDNTSPFMAQNQRQGTLNSLLSFREAL